MSALSAFKVLELSQDVSGEYCGKLLADFGAEVIKVEEPGCGSPTRRLGPFAPVGWAESSKPAWPTSGMSIKQASTTVERHFIHERNIPAAALTASSSSGKLGFEDSAQPTAQGDRERSGLFAYLNTNKRSVAFDVRTATGADTLTRLIDRVDVVIDDHPPGWLQSVSLDPATVHQMRPQLVLCAITAYGQSPPEDRKHAEDLNVFHSSGWGYHTPSAAEAGKLPLKGPGRFLPSYEAGLEAAMCIVAAVYERMASQRGQFIDISKQRVLASRLDYVLGQMVAGDMDVSTARTAFDLSGPAGIFRCRDGYAYIWMSTPSHWEALRRLLGRPQWMRSFPERWLELECTPQRVAECRHHIAEWLQTQDKHEVAAAAQQLGLTLVAVNDAKDLLASPQYVFRKFFAEVNHPVLGPALYPTVPYKLSDTPASFSASAPLLGQDTANIVGGSV